MKRDIARTIISQHLGRDLLPTELVHHKDEDRSNNGIGNLQIVTRAEHCRIHKPVKGYKFTPEQRKKLSEAHKGQAAWNKGLYGGYACSEETRRKISEKLKGRIITWGDKITIAKTKVHKDKVLEYLKQKPEATLSDLKKVFNVQSNTPFQKLGGLRRLRKEAVL